MGTNPFADGFFKKHPPMKIEDAVRSPGTVVVGSAQLENLYHPVVDSYKFEPVVSNSSAIVQPSEKQIIIDEIKMVEGMLLNLVVKLKNSGANNAAKVIDKARDGVRRILEVNE